MIEKSLSVLSSKQIDIKKVVKGYIVTRFFGSSLVNVNDFEIRRKCEVIRSFRVFGHF